MPNWLDSEQGGRVTVDVTMDRLRAAVASKPRGKHLTRFENFDLKVKGQNLALTVLYIWP
jgi:hypothetical protein